MAIGMKDTNEDEKEIVTSLNEESPTTNNKNKNNITTIVIVAVVVILIIVLINGIGKNSNKDSATMATTENISSENSSSEEASSAENVNGNSTTEVVVEDNGTEVTIGLPEFDKDENGQTTAVVYSASDYIKDLNGSDIPAVYTVAERTYVRDFVNYEAKRAILDDGMEMYWLEIQYKNKPYRCQVPYFIFKDLDAVGICVVEIELLTLEGGEQVISFMQVVSDYSELINK